MAADDEYGRFSATITKTVVIVIQGCFSKKFIQSVGESVFQSVPHFSHVRTDSSHELRDLQHFMFEQIDLHVF